MGNRLQGKRCIVSGGAAGIGEATVRLMIEEGASVAFMDWNEARGKTLARELGGAGHTVSFGHVPVQDPAAVEAYVDAATGELGGLDVLVNNAGIRAFMTVAEATEEDWDRILGVNLKGYAFCAKAAIPRIRESGGGAIVNVASIRSLTAGPRTVLYDTTKGAVLSMTRSMARDHAGEGIRVNAVGPGPIWTDHHVARAAELGQSEEDYVRAFGEETMMARPGTPREIAQGIVFLASDDASYVTGTCLYIDGGTTAQ